MYECGIGSLVNNSNATLIFTMLYANLMRTLLWLHWLNELNHVWEDEYSHQSCMDCRDLYDELYDVLSFSSMDYDDTRYETF